ncbi:thrombospondin type 3 repeat-containing protein [Candidatus Woesearchaeota archaeon]|nr:thrombospondin type 3 repeat-containing protein [Candidatus Woesearchaeota archaeon]
MADRCSAGVLDWTSDSSTDYDGDGCKDDDAEDGDKDNDGVADDSDDCAVGTINWDETSGYDHDEDGCEGNEDSDDDNDGVADSDDDCSEGNADWTSSSSTTDYDGDGCKDDDEDPNDDNDVSSDDLDCDDNNAMIYPGALEICDGVDNNCELGIDENLFNCNDDGDTFLNSADNCPLVTNEDQDDTDEDNAGNACDTCSNDASNDIDEDGICGDGDSCSEDSSNDADDDGICGVGLGTIGKMTGPDNCPNKANTDNTDTDGDGFGDVCDNCIAVGNAGQGDVDKDGKGDACDTDGDNDGRLNVNDNCDLIKNRDQKDSDGDGKGDVCDEDIDSDLVVSGFYPVICSGGVHTNCNDNCVYTANRDQADHDTDSSGDLCDTDDDNDGISDLFDTCTSGVTGWISTYSLDHDSDGCLDSDAEDGDDDNDGVLDSSDLTCPLSTSRYVPDTDHDGCFDDEDNDKDADGVVNTNDACPSGLSSGLDTDTDGCKDSEDNDDDNDGKVDCGLDGICGDESSTPENESLDDDPCPLNIDCDNDSILDLRDNCPLVKNGMYNDDLTSSALMNVAACDVDGGGLSGAEISTCNQTDSDLDGVGDACDNCPTINNPTQEAVEGCGMCRDGGISTPNLNMELQKYFPLTCTPAAGEVMRSSCVCDTSDDDDCLDNGALPSVSSVKYYGCGADGSCGQEVIVGCNAVHGEFCSNGACVTLNNPNPDGTCPMTDSYTYEKGGYTYRRTGEGNVLAYTHTVPGGSLGTTTVQTINYCVPEQVMLCTADKDCWLDGDKCVAGICTQAICGNGIKEPSEGCDDGNVASPGCSDLCQIESGYYCTETNGLSACQLAEDGFKTDLRNAIQTVKTALADDDPANDVQEKETFITSVKLALQRLFG